MGKTLCNYVCDSETARLIGQEMERSIGKKLRDRQLEMHALVTWCDHSLCLPLVEKIDYPRAPVLPW
jgi:hypothetical protein